MTRKCCWPTLAVVGGSICILRLANPASEETRTAFRELVKRRAAGTPVAYLVGHREFYSLDFEVNPDVLIPRPETELLGRDAARLWLNSVGRRDAAIAIADVGTGSGIIAICAAKYVPTAQVKAIDISPRGARGCAGEMPRSTDVADRIEFVEVESVESAESGECSIRFYRRAIRRMYRRAEMEQLAVDVREHEPELALRAGEARHRRDFAAH